MIIETKYDAGQTIYIVVGTDDKAKVIPSQIQSIYFIMAAMSGVRVIYNCVVNRRDTETFVEGMPETYTIEKSEDKMFETLEKCVESITRRR